MKISKLLRYLFLGLVGLLLVAEVMVRLLVSPPMDPGRTFILENEIAGLKPRVQYEIDSNQIRGWDSTRPKPAGVIRILCVGGSSTSTMLQSVEDTWWGQLGTALEKSLGKKVQIGGVTAPITSKPIPGAQWIDHLLAEVDGVDLVIATYGHGSVIHPAADFSFDAQAIAPMTFEKKGGLKQGLAKASHLLRWIRNARIKSKRNDQQRQLGTANYLRDQIRRANQSYRSVSGTSAGPTRAADPIAAYLHGLGLFMQAAEKHRVKLLIVGEPTVFSALISPDAAQVLHSPVHIGPSERDFARPDPGWVESELERYYSAASRLCAAAGIPFITLQGTVLPGRANFYTESTLTDEGASMAAEALLPVVERSLK